MTATAVDEFTELMEAYDETPACEGSEHPNSTYGHVADMPAEYAMSWACTQCEYTATVLNCAGRAQSIVALLAVVELSCGHYCQKEQALIQVRPI